MKNIFRIPEKKQAQTYPYPRKIMQYTAVHLKFTFAEDFAADIFIAQLAEMGFESFENDAEGIIAYIPSINYRECCLKELIREFPYSGVEIRESLMIADRNWNEEWEKHFFQPIVIDNKCVIHSSFHTDIPAMEYDILIDPKMAFGTGHHATTSLIVSELLHIDLSGKSLLDMGCGTAILAILASKRGADPILAVDIDSWCTENSLENIALNNVTNIEVRQGDARLLSGLHFDIILANINRNILLVDMHAYADCLPQGGVLYMSGFYTEDVPLIEAEALKSGLRMTACREKDNWAVVKMEK